MENAKKWGIVGLLLPIIFYIVSLIITGLIVDNSAIRVLLALFTLIFAVMTIYAGKMAYTYGSKVLGGIDITLGILLILIIIISIIKLLQTMIENLPTL